MPVIVSIIDNHGNAKQLISVFTDDDTKLLKDIAKQENMQSLKFIDYVGDAIFNKIQAFDIAQSIEKILPKNLIDRHILDLLRLGAQAVMSGHNVYLKFEGE